jgi:hypothetical protein
MSSTRIDEPEWAFPFEFMKPGDSFFVPTLRPLEMVYIVDSRAKAAKVKVKAYASSKDGYIGVRVWRIT